MRDGNSSGLAEWATSTNLKKYYNIVFELMLELGYRVPNKQYD